MYTYEGKDVSERVQKGDTKYFMFNERKEADSFAKDKKSYYYPIYKKAETPLSPGRGRIIGWGVPK